MKTTSANYSIQHIILLSVRQKQLHRENKMKKLLFGSLTELALIIFTRCITDVALLTSGLFAHLISLPLIVVVTVATITKEMKCQTDKCSTGAMESKKMEDMKKSGKCGKGKCGSS